MNTLTGYTEIELPEGRKIPLKYGMWSFRELCKRWDTVLTEIEKTLKERTKTDPIGVYIDLLSVGAEFASHLNGEPRSFSEMEVSTWVDETGGLSGSPVLAKAMEAFVGALGSDKAPQTKGGAGAKKK